MEQSARRQILADLGIVPWQLRVVPGDAVADSAPRTQAEPAPEPEPRPAAPAAGPAQPAAAPAPSAAPREAPWSALSLVSGTALLLVEGDASRRDLRLAMDVLGAATGNFGVRPASRRFDWPPPGAEQTVAAAADSAPAGKRALLAFVDKDLSDHGVRRVLCTAGLDARLPALPEGIERVTVPELAALGQDPDAKRSLWQTLRSRGA